MEGHAKKCVERCCELANKTTQQLTKLQLHALMIINLKKKNWDLLDNCQQCALKLFLIDCIWHALVDQTFYVCEQACKCCHQMDQSLWQTFRTFDLLYSSHEWILAILSCWKPCPTMQVRTVSRLWFCRRSWRLKIDFRENFVHIWKSHACVQETNFCFTQFDGIWDYLSWSRSTHGWNPSSWSWGFGDWSISFRTEQNWWTQERHTVKLVGICKGQTCITPSQSSTPTSFQQTFITFHQIQRILVPFFSQPTKKSKVNVQGNLPHDTSSRKQTNSQTKTPTQHNDLELCNVD